MIKIFNYGEVPNSEIFARDNIAPDVEGIVADIIATVIKEGDSALYGYAKKFDRAELTSLEVTKSEIDEALKTEPFGEVAKKYSSDARAKDGGQWKDIKPEDVFRPEVCAEIAKMKKGETSKWIELDGWNFLVRKDDETTGVKLSFEEAYDAVAQNVRKELADKRYRDWINRLKSETYIKVY